MKIKSISREKYNGKVYNIGTLPNHNYIANNILVHNCYKSNTNQGNNMSLETYKEVLDKFPDNLTQVAFGIGDIDTNPDLWKIMEYTRSKGIIPNITINGSRMTDEYYGRLASVCGAVAVSNYGKKLCYTAVQKLNERKVEGSTLKQVNIHQLLSEETLDTCWELLHDMKTDERLKDLNAVVFLMMKPKGDRNFFHMMKDAEKYKELVNYALDNRLKIGFDSCTAPSFLRAVKERTNYKQLEQNAEACESTLFSYYVDVEGKGWPCSFSEGEPGIKSIDLLEVKDFMKEVWNNKQTVNFRNKLIDSKEKFGCRQCPLFNLEIG